MEKEREKELEKELEKERDKERVNEEEKKPEQENIQLIINDLFDNNQEIVKSETTDDEQSNDLDSSWLNEHERLLSVNENYKREPMEEVNIFFIYINRNQYIEKIINDKINLVLSEDKKHSYLPKESLLQIIQSRKLKTSFSKYKLLDVLTYLVDLEPENIQSYSKNENNESSSKFLNTVSIMNDIKFNESIFIFHGINSIYFIFEEIELINHRHTIKSILKPIVREVTDKTNTKKVRIQLGTVDSSNKKKGFKGTRKRI